MNEQRYFIKLAYKGTHFFGWQVQPNAITVQETLANALEQLNRGKPVKITGCGRTDTGVHASQYFAHFNLNTDLDEATLVYKMNCMISTDISIHHIQKVHPDLHSRFSATARTYHYNIHTSKNPFLNETSWFLRQTLDLKTMNDACGLLINHKNFKCFSKTITGISSFECNVNQAFWESTPDGFRFTIKANRFLRNMVRAIVGTMVDLGTRKINLQDFQAILDNQDRNQAGKSVPAQGLFLVKIDYENNPEIQL